MLNFQVCTVAQKELLCYPDVSIIIIDVGDPTNVNPIALRMAKIAYNFGLSECNRVKVLY